MTTSTATATVTLAEDLQALGFRPGAPAHVPAAIVETDIRIYRRQRCPGCRQRGMTVQPYHCGREYRIVCSCRHCGQQVEG